jgi:hypothetical protein
VSRCSAIRRITAQKREAPYPLSIKLVTSFEVLGKKLVGTDSQITVLHTQSGTLREKALSGHSTSLAATLKAAVCSSIIWHQSLSQII